MAVSSIAVTDVDLFSDEVMADPYPLFARLREQGAAVYFEKNDLWGLTRYETIREALADWETFSSSGVAFNDQMNQVLVGTTLATDPPKHAAMRAVLSENLTPRALRSMKAQIEQKADDLVAALVVRGSFDAMEDLAKALPLQVVADLIGLQGEARDNVLRWGDAAFDCLGPMNERARQAFPVAGELFKFAYSVTAENLTAGSMGRAIFEAGERGEIPRETCGKIIHQYIAAGMDTTIASIGNAMRQFARNPQLLGALREDPSLIPGFFNEVLRHESPAHALGRRVMKDVQIDGTLIPAGSQVALLFGSGNRDARQYPDPDTFDVNRNPVDHLAFGYGTHGCAGQGLARLEAHAVIGAVSRRIAGFEVGAEVRKPGNTTRALSSLPVTSLVPVS